MKHINNTDQAYFKEAFDQKKRKKGLFYEYFWRRQLASLAEKQESRDS